jgi:tetratricopeptide (TPR) repeat protein
MDHGDVAAAARQLQRAYASEPSSAAELGSAAGLISVLGRVDDAVVLGEYVAARDPLSPRAHLNLGWDYLRAGRPDDAIASGRRALEVSPRVYWAHLLIGTALMLKGEHEAALGTIEAEPWEPARLQGLALVHERLGNTRAAEENLARLIERHERSYAYQIACVLAFRDDADGAFARLEKALVYHDTGLIQAPHEPLLASLASDPRWLLFLRRIGMDPQRIGTLAFHVALPD